jgi:hypothetical protein
MIVRLISSVNEFVCRLFPLIVVLVLLSIVPFVLLIVALLMRRISIVIDIFRRFIFSLSSSFVSFA